VSFTIDVNTFFPVTIPDVTTSSAGLMSAADKIKLDSLTPGGGGTLAQAYGVGQSAADQTLVIDPLNGGAVVFERNDVALNAGFAYTALEVLNTTEANGLGASRQNSPVMRLGGQVYVSEPKGSYALDWLTQVEITASIGTAAGDLVFSRAIDGAATERVRFSWTAGRMYLAGTGIFVDGASEGDALVCNGDDFVPMRNTLAQVYANGSSAADQTIVITNGNGGEPQISRSGVGTNVGVGGLVIKTGTAGTPLTPQYSPALILRGSADASGPTDVDFRLQVYSQNGGGGPATGALVIDSSIGGGPSTPLFSVLASVGTVRIGSLGLQLGAASQGQAITWNGILFTAGAAGGWLPYRLMPDADYTVVDGDCYLNSAAQTAGRDVLLPTAFNNQGRMIIVAATGFSMSVTAQPGDNIDGSAQVYPGGPSVWAFVSDGVNQWRVIYS